MRWTVDRIEEGYAVLEHPETLLTHDRPLPSLPKGVKERDILVEEDGVWRIDAEARERRVAELSARFNRIVKGASKN